MNRKSNRVFLQAIKAIIYLPRIFRKPAIAGLTLLDISPSGACFEISEKIKVPKQAAIDIYFDDSIKFSLKCSLIYIQGCKRNEQQILGVEFIDAPQKLKDMIIRRSLLSKVQNVEIQSQFFAKTENPLVHSFSRNRIEYTVFIYSEHIDVWTDNKQGKEKIKTAYVDGYDDAGNAVPVFIAELVESLQSRKNKLTPNKSSNAIEVEEVVKSSSGQPEITEKEAEHFRLTSKVSDT